MNQPTREEFDDFKQEIRQEVKRIEQQTEPINVRIERGLPVPEATLLQTIMTMVGTQATDVALLKGSMEGAKADIKAIRESQADFRDKLTELKGDITSIKATQEQILKLLQQKSGE